MLMIERFLLWVILFSALARFNDAVLISGRISRDLSTLALR